MKTIRTIATVILAAFLVLGPLAAFGATSMTISTNASSYAGQATITVSGSVTPAPTVASAVVITTRGPSGVVDTGEAAVSTVDGSYSYVFVTGGSSAWTTGTYTVNGTWGAQGNTATAVTTFSYTAAGVGGGAAAAPIIYIYVSSASQVSAGQTVQIEAMTVWSNNGTLATASTLTGTLVAPGATATSGGASLGSAAFSSKGEYYWNYAVPANAGNGAYMIQVLAKDGGYVGWGLGSFTVISPVATPAEVSAVTTAVTAAQTALTTTLSSITTSLTLITTSLGTINTNVQALSLTGVQSSLNTISTGVTGITNTLSGLSTNLTTVGGISSQLSTLTTAVNNNQTYVLVVAALAAITLVLELAILVRKLS